MFFILKRTERRAEMNKSTLTFKERRQIEKMYSGAACPMGIANCLGRSICPQKAWRKLWKPSGAWSGTALSFRRLYAPKMVAMKACRARYTGVCH